jgi:hypothetical protein
MIPDADDDPFPHVFKVDRLYPEEQDFVADDTTLSLRTRGQISMSRQRGSTCLRCCPGEIPILQ